MLESFLFFASSSGVEEFSATCQNRSFRLQYLLGNNALVCFENGDSVQSLPIPTIRAGGKCRLHNFNTFNEGISNILLPLVSRVQIKNTDVLNLVR